MSENHLITERKNKIADWEALGFKPYGTKFDRTHTSEQASLEIEKNKEALRDPGSIMKSELSDIDNKTLCGRIIAMRDMGKLSFLKIRDISGDFQICLSQALLGDKFKKLIKALDIGDFCGFEGEFFITKHGESTLMAKTVSPLSKSIRPLPEKWHGLTDKESCYRDRNLDLATNPETFNRFVLRSKMVKEVRHFFEEKKFLEVETSILQAQSGGAMARVFNTHHNALDHDFVLRIALELDLKRAVGGGMERVFEIGKNFRNEGSDPSHLQEFTMCEWYAAYKDLEVNKQWTEELFHRLCKNVFKQDVFVVVDTDGNETEIDFGKKFDDRSFPDLLVEYANLDMFTATDEEIRIKAKEVGVEKIDGIGRGNLLDDIYKKTARPQLIQPTFVYNYPESLKPLAAPNGDGTASCFQLVVNSWEIVNSYGELIDPMVQRRLLEEQSAAKKGGDDEAMEVDEVFLGAMEHGFPPMTGSGFGIDRLCAILTGQSNLRDVVLFPTMKPEAGSAVNKNEVKKITEIKKESSLKNEEVLLDADLEITRDDAWELVKTRCDFALQRHNAFVAQSMEALAVSLGKEDQKDVYYITGLLHDVDWNDTISTPELHCAEPTMQYLKENNVPEVIRTAIQTHHLIFDLPIDSDLKKALLAVDEISGFAVAVAQMRPTKMMGINPKSIVKKMKDKRFAAGVDRDHMKFCESYFDQSVQDLLLILIPSWEGLAADWELV